MSHTSLFILIALWLFSVCTEQTVHAQINLQSTPSTTVKAYKNTVLVDIIAEAQSLHVSPQTTTAYGSLKHSGADADCETSLIVHHNIFGTALTTSTPLHLLVAHQYP